MRFFHQFIFIGFIAAFPFFFEPAPEKQTGMKARPALGANDVLSIPPGSPKP